MSEPFMYSLEWIFDDQERIKGVQCKRCGLYWGLGSFEVESFVSIISTHADNHKVQDAENIVYLEDLMKLPDPRFEDPNQ